MIKKWTILFIWLFRRRGAIILLIVPLVLYICWYNLELRQIHILDDGFEMQGGYITPEEYCILTGVLSWDYEIHKNEYSLDLKKIMEGEIAEKEKQYPNLTSAITSIFLDKIGVLAKVPKYEVCLKNNNVIYIENQKVKNFKIDNFTIPSQVGALGVRQDGQNVQWYNEINHNDNDCKDVDKDYFLNASTTLEYRYFLKTDIGPEDKEKLLKGEEYKFYINSLKIDTSKSSFYIKLKFWRNIWLYFVILLIWSPIFFQLKKIIDYIVEKHKTGNSKKQGLSKKRN